MNHVPPKQIVRTLAQISPEALMSAIKHDKIGSQHVLVLVLVLVLELVVY